MNFGDFAQFHNRSFAKATFNLGKRLLDRLFTLACGSRHDCTASIHHRLILLTHWLSQLQGVGYRDCAVPLPCVPPYFYAANPLKGRGISHRLIVARNTNCVVATTRYTVPYYLFSGRVAKAETGLSPCLYLYNVERVYHSHKYMSSSFWHPTGRSKPRPYRSRRPSIARPRVPSSAYSRSPPIGRPRARPVTRTLKGFSSFWM